MLWKKNLKIKFFFEIFLQNFKSSWNQNFYRKKIILNFFPENLTPFLGYTTATLNNDPSHDLMSWQDAQKKVVMSIHDVTGPSRSQKKVLLTAKSAYSLWDTTYDVERDRYRQMRWMGLVTSEISAESGHDNPWRDRS